ncbi:MAG: hypothetical protein WBF73_08755 [Bradyrhizobium sp.]|jgi:hypothetical protein
MRVNYKAYIIDAYERETGRWRAAISRQDGAKIRVVAPPAEHLQVVTSADTLTSQEAVNLAKLRIDNGGMI